MAPTPAQAQANRVATASKKNRKGGKSSSSGSTNARVQRYLKSTAPQLVERQKSVLLLKGIHCSRANLMLIT